MWPFPSFGFAKALFYVCAPLLEFSRQTEGFPEMCWASPLSAFQCGREERRKPKWGTSNGHMIALQSAAKISPFLWKEWVRVIVHLGIECNKVTKNSTLILFLSFFSLHSMLFIPCYSYLFLCISFYSSTPFSVSMGLCFVRCGLLAPHTAHPFFLQSGWRPSGRAHYFTIFAFTKPEAPPFKQCTP